jgi:hypothetical protein
MIAELTQNTDNQIPKQNHNNRPETELLLYCIRYQLGTATSAEIAHLLQQDLDWNYFRQKAAQHNVFLLVYETLNKTHPQLIPREISQQLQSYAQQRIARNLFLTKELLRLLNLFAAHEIKAIPFKGPVWATLAYGNMAVREFCDLDILVRESDFSQAKELLIQEGYRDPLFGTQEAVIRQVQMVRQDDRVKVDLHYGLLPEQFYLELDSEPFWQRLQTISIAGKTVQTFSPEDSIALAYLHGTKDSWGMLKRICDFAAFIGHCPEVNWQEILQRCATNERDRNFWLAIEITRTYLQISVPEAILLKIQAFPELTELASEHQQLFYRTEMGVKPSLFGGLRLFPLMGMNLWDKARYVFGVLFNVNRRDREIYTLPGYLFFLYYPLRIIRLIKSYKIGPEKIAFLWKLLWK